METKEQRKKKLRNILDKTYTVTNLLTFGFFIWTATVMYKLGAKTEAGVIALVIILWLLLIRGDKN